MRYLIYIYLLLVSIESHAQNSTAILLKADSVLNTFTTGSYHAQFRFKGRTDVGDTSTFRGDCIFQRMMVADTVQFTRYHLTMWPRRENIYDGTYELDLNDSLKTGTRYNIAKKQWRPYLSGSIQGELLYRYFFKRKRSLKNYTTGADYSLQMGNAEKVNGEPCYVIYIAGHDTDPKYEARLYISHRQLIPVKLIEVFTDKQGVQYDETIISNLKINLGATDLHFDAKTDPPGFAIKNYKTPPPYKEPKIKKFPTWQLTNLKGDTIRSQAYAGKLVLYDFSYRSCPPCIESIPTLEKLYSDYKSKGLEIVAVNPYETDTMRLNRYCADYGIHYTYLTNGMELARQMKVAAYPTFVLVNGKGKVVYRCPGYGKGLDKIWRAELDKQLAN